MARTCCPLYTIRCEATQLALTKSQKKVIKRFLNFVLLGSRAEGGTAGERMEEEGGEGRGGEEGRVQRAQAALGLHSLADLDTNLASNVIQSNCDIATSQPTKPVSGEVKSEEPADQQPAVMAAVAGRDTSKPMQGKAKLARRERWQQKLREGKAVEKPRENREKSLEDLMARSVVSTLLYL